VEVDGEPLEAAVPEKDGTVAGLRLGTRDLDESADDCLCVCRVKLLFYL
jgi:hypothetical protein